MLSQGMQSSQIGYFNNYVYENTVRNYDRNDYLKREGTTDGFLKRDEAHNLDEPKSIKLWNKIDFLNWIANEFMTSAGVDEFDFSLENFYKLETQEISKLLNTMNLFTFKRLDPEYGECMYRKLLEYENRNELFKQCRFSRPNGYFTSDSSFSSDSESSLENGRSCVSNGDFSGSNIYSKDLSAIQNLSKEFENLGSTSQSGKRSLRYRDCLHVWQFCRNLLKDSNHNPSVIEWINKGDLVFRINDKDKMAYLWGMKRNNKNMTYDNMSRGIRYSRSTSGFFRMPDGKYRKRFVFQFGDKAVERCEYLRSLVSSN